MKVRVPVRSRGWVPQNRPPSAPAETRMEGLMRTDSPSFPSGDRPSSTSPIWKVEKGLSPSLSRFILLSYFPSGFWPRLMSRLLSDDRVVEIVRNYFCLPPPAQLTPEVSQEDGIIGFFNSAFYCFFIKVCCCYQT